MNEDHREFQAVAFKCERDDKPLLLQQSRSSYGAQIAPAAHWALSGKITW